MMGCPLLWPARITGVRIHCLETPFRLVWGLLSPWSCRSFLTNRYPMNLLRHPFSFRSRLCRIVSIGPTTAFWKYHSYVGHIFTWKEWRRLFEIEFVDGSSYLLLRVAIISPMLSLHTNPRRIPFILLGGLRLWRSLDLWWPSFRFLKNLLVGLLAFLTYCF